MTELAATTSKAATPPRDLAGDIWGGLAAMLVAMPSAIAFGVTIYAPLGGEHAAQGALAGILGTAALGLIAPALGGCQRLITAPCAPAAAVLCALALQFMQAGQDPHTIILLMAMIALLAGGFQIALGLAGVGRLIKFIPFPVVSGYLSGVGLIIIGSQLPKLLGTAAGTSFLGALSHPDTWDWRSALVGGAVIAVMVFIPRLTQRVPAAIVALISGIAAYVALGLAGVVPLATSENPLLVGLLSTGGSSLHAVIRDHWQALSHLGIAAAMQVAVPALTLAVLLSIDTLKTCVVIDAMTNSHHDSDRELIGQGAGNLASALIGGIPGAGTMGATLINISSGGHSKKSGMLEGAFAVAAYLALAPLIAWVPVAALAGILIVIGARMIDRHSLQFFYSESTRVDFAVIVIVILVALFGNLIAASGVGVALAILLFIREQTRSSVVRTRIDGSEVFTRRAHLQRDGSREIKSEDTVIFELQGSLFFGTANQLHMALEAEAGRRKYVILSMRRVQSLDVTATHVLEQIKDKLEEHDAYLVFCDIPKGLPSGLKMKRFLKDTGVVRPTNKAFAFRQLDEALEWVENQEMPGATDHPGNMQAIALKDMPVFAPFAEPAIAQLEALMERRTIKAGKKVFKAASFDTELFLIRRGTVKITVPVGKKESYHLATCGPGDMIGGMDFVDGHGHSADALALDEVDVWVLSREALETLARSESGLAIRLIEHVARNLSNRLRVTISELQALRG